MPVWWKLDLNGSRTESLVGFMFRCVEWKISHLLLSYDN